jgi:hypothetical protein
MYAADGYTSFLINFYDLSSPESQITAWTWNFGDGTPDVSEQNPSHKFGLAGDYVVKLTISRGTEQSSVSKTISIHYTADFDWTKAVYTNIPAHFTDKTIYACPNGTTQTWSCDNLPTYTSPSADYVFPRAGTYNVKLCVTDNCGNSFCGTKSVTVVDPINDLVPGFTCSALVIAKGQSITFTDTSTPGPSKQPIAWWTWWFQQPSGLTDENPVQNSANTFYYKYQDKVTYVFNTAGTFKVRLYIGTFVTYAPGDDAHKYPVPGDKGVYFEQTIQVKDTPELTAGFSENETSQTSDFALSSNLYAVVHSADPSNPGIAVQYISVFKKIGENDSKVWEPRELYVGDDANFRCNDFKIFGDHAFLQMQPVTQTGPNFDEKFRYVIVGAGQVTRSCPGCAQSLPRSSSLPDLFDLPFPTSPNFNVFGDEMVIAQTEKDGNFYIYVVQKPASGFWSQSTVTKHKIAYDLIDVVGKIFIDENAIVAQLGRTSSSKIYIIEKQNGVWDFANAKIIQEDGSFLFDFSYANNTVITVTRPFDCPSLTWPVANVYERPPMGWPAVTNATTASLSLKLDSDISADTKICTPKVSMSEKYAVIKVDLTNGSSTFNRTYVFKKFYGIWVNSGPTLKVKNSDTNLPTETTNYDLINCFVNGKVEIYNYLNYCLLSPIVQRSFSISGPNYDVVNGSITFGDASYTGSTPIAVINANAKINYFGTNISLLPGFNAKAGSTVSITSFASCDDLYNR